MKNINLLSGRHIKSQRKKNGIYNSIFKSEEKKRKKQKNTTRKDPYLNLFLGGDLVFEACDDENLKISESLRVTFSSDDKGNTLPKAQGKRQSPSKKPQRKNFSKLGPRRRNPQARVLSSRFCFKIIHLVIVFLKQKSVCFFLKHTAYNTLLYKK